jgi:hypothetical protein
MLPRCGDDGIAGSEYRWIAPYHPQLILELPDLVHKWRRLPLWPDCQHSPISRDRYPLSSKGPACYNVQGLQASLQESHRKPIPV